MRVVLLVGLLLGAPIIALGQLSDEDARGRLAADEARSTVETAQRAADLIAAQIATVSAQLRSAAVSETSDLGAAIDTGDIDSVRALLRQFQGLMGATVRRLTATDRSGRILVTVPRDDRLAGSSLADKDYFTALSTGPSRAYAISAIYRLDTANAQPGVAIAYPIRPALTGGNAPPVGFLVGEIDLQDLPSRLTPFRTAVEDLYVLDASGQLIGQAAVAAVGRQNPNMYRPVRDDPAVRGLAPGVASSALDPLGHGRRVLASALVLDTAWRVIAVRDSSLVERETNTALFQLASLRMALVVLLLVGAYVLSRVTRRVARQRAALADSNARIAETNLQLAHATEAKSQFLANMSHELRTPLNAIIGFADVLGQRMFGDLNVKQADYVNDIVGSGRHLLSLINDILDLAKVEAGRMVLEPTAFSLRESLGAGMTMVRERAADHRLALTLDVAADVDVITADERKVKQVVFNLLSNAVKFTPDGGRITVSATRTADEVHVAVRDSGAGIAPADQAALFTEFAQTEDGRRAAEGTGLGLALTKKLVELHGGRIWVESQLGAGSTFTFALPLLVEAASS
ncbi:MAG: ATP-binding protein [Chloroflexota bacterium]